ncbi:hypothetical protein BH11PAT2_BH11PAT2_00920 [soil metagenome]
MNHLSSFFAHASAHGLSASAESATTSGIGAILGVIFAVLLVILAVVALMVVSMWIIFKKAGKPGWAALIPFYNTATWIQIVRKPLWWMPLLIFVPIVNIALCIILTRRLAAVFGKGPWFTVGLIVLPFIFLPILAFGSAQYVNNYQEPAPMSEAVKWTLIVAGVFMLLEASSLGGLLRDIDAQGGLAHSKPLTILSSGSSYDSSYEGFATDGNYVYYDDVPITGADAVTFQLKGNGYGADDHAVYYYDQELPGADPATFEEIDNGKDGYAKDAAHVYAGQYVIPGADPATFESLGLDYSKDAHAVYAYIGGANSPSEISGADVASFEVIEQNYTDSTTYDAKDKNHYYLYGEVVKGK